MMTMMAGAIVSPSLPQISKIFEHIEHHEILSKLVVTLPAIFIAVIAPFAGYIIDRFGRKKLLQFSLLLYAVAGCSGFYFHDLYLILAGRAFLGIAVAGIMTTVLTLIGDYFSGEERNKYMGLQGAFMGIGGVLFISVSGLLADYHWQYPFLIYAFSLIVLIFATIFLYEPDINYKKTDRLNKDNLPEYNKNRAYLIYLIVFVGIVFFFMYPVQIPYLLKSIEGVSNAMVGYSISVATLSGSIIALNYNRFKRLFSFPFIYGLTFLLMGLGYLIVSFADSYEIFIVGLIISGSSTGLLMPTGNLWLISIAPAQIRGRLVGRLSTAFFLGQFLSPILVQPIINYADLSGAFLYASILLFVFSLTLIAYCTFWGKIKEKAK